MKLKNARYIVPVIMFAVLTVSSCFDTYNDLLDNMDNMYLFSIVETGSSSARILNVDARGNIVPGLWNLNGLNFFKSFFADFNSDGNIDILTMKSFADNPVISFSDGNGNFISSISLPPISNFVYDIAIADFDNNGYPDIVVGTSGGIQKYFYKNNYPSGFSAPVIIAVSSNNGSGLGLTEADFDGDGDKDVYIGNNGASSDSSQVWINSFNTGAGFTNRAFWTPSPPVNTHIEDSTAGDIDNDGDMDIIEVGTSAPYTQVWLNTGNGYFTPGWNFPVSLNFIELADLDGDGDLDAYGGNKTGTTNYVFINNGKGVFTEIPHMVPTLTYSIALGDIDFDGNIDLIVSGGTALYIYKNDGNAGFSLLNIYPSLGNSKISIGAIYR